MKIPKTIKIGGKIFEIELRNNRSVKDGASTGASSSNWSQKIWIDNDQHLEGQEEALIHEIIEMLDSDNDLNLSHQTISTLAISLYQVLKDNDLLK